MSNAVLVSLFEHKAWSNQRLVASLRAAPEDVDRGRMAVALFTLDHTSIVDRIFQGHISGADHGYAGVVATRFPELEGLAARLAETDAWYLDYAGRATADDLETVVDFSFVDDGSAGRMTKAQMLAHVITHAAAHRGAIGASLAEMKVAGSPDMVTSLLGSRAGGG